MPSTTDASLPSYVHPALVAAQEDLALMHDLLAGTRRMHERSTTYIRKWKDEDPKVYEIRRQCETLFEGLGRTLSAAVGMLFAKAPQIEWNAAESAMAEHWANIDAAGTAGPVFLKRFAEGAIRDGLQVILVDHPPAPKDAQGRPITITAANEGPLGLRPTWAMYGRGQAINWRVGKVNNRTALTMLVLHEPTQVDDGLYGTKTVQRYRVLRLIPGEDGAPVAAWTLYELEKDENGKEKFRVKNSGFFRNRLGQYARFLPVAIAYTGRTDAPMTASIPLLGVAWANLSHWQQATNLRFYRDLSAFPQPVVEGELAPDPVTHMAATLKVGPLAVVNPQNGGKFYWAELTGSGMAQIVEGRDEALRQISKLGVSFLATDTRAAETAEAKRLDATAENSTLATAAQGIEDGVNLAHEITAWYLGIEKAGAPVLTISREYESTGMPADLLTAYVGAVANAGLPPRLLLNAMQQGGLISADVDIEELALEMEVNRIQADEQKRIEAEARAEAFTERVAA